ncbi:biotin transporter BioY [Lutispora thermophila]|uniref:Biotin transporter n=1 Tax=Lutispora thermophila DSM 19022 TaxID=1122184 RepID=A0A1M6B1U3_9FIRM|nr:biotin transporter BioY [Lutispora thermophila]SHI42676.1 biotin transport system substrate-specific component [Lutispora thermophila DSM 19022]
MKLTTKEITMVSLFVALITIGSKITIPSPIVPFTLQWMFVALSGMLLGAKLGAISMAVYIILGLIGLPVFAKGGGIGYVVSPTFGYLLGFIAAAYIIGKAVEGMKDIRFAGIFGAMVLGLLVVYTIGVSYMYLMLNFYIGKSITISKAIWTGALIFVPTDLLSAVVCSLLGVRVGGQIRAIISN